MINGQETGADIISEMRRAKTEFPFVYLMGEPDTPEVIDAKTKEIVAPRKINIRRVTVSELADRFEAAYKRECGNAAALREALEDSQSLLESFSRGEYGAQVREQMRDNRKRAGASDRRRRRQQEAACRRPVRDRADSAKRKGRCSAMLTSIRALYYELDDCALRLEESAKCENVKVRKRVEKICRELRGLREYALNIAKPVDFIDFSSVKGIGDYLRKMKQKVLCAGCHKDITYTGGWEFPQEPKKYYCDSCQSAMFSKHIGKIDKEVEKMRRLV